MKITPEVGKTFWLNGATVKVTKIESGIEYGDRVLYVTGINGLGQTVTQWIYA